MIIFCVFAGLVVLGLAFSFAGTSWDGDMDRYSRDEAARRGTHPAGRTREESDR